VPGRRTRPGASYRPDRQADKIASSGGPHVERVRRWFEELRSRRVFRAVAAYGLVAFAALQVSEPVVHGLRLPEWTVTALVILSAAGFPIVLVLAWFFDLGPRGLSRARPAPAAQPAPATPRERVGAGPVAPGAMTALLEELAHAPDVAPAALAPLRPGDAVGRFELLREIGRGGFGVVFEARDRELGRLVALKTVRPRRGVDPSTLRAEAEAVAQLQHPNIVTVHDAGFAGGEAWIVLELLRGETLEGRLHRGPVGRDEALRLSTAVARGLAHAHRAGVVHRDLKPANVFLCDDGGVKILDFGLSRMLGSSSADGGTPAYMAPEQWRGEAQDARTDVFAAGVMLFELLAAARPYAVESGRSAALDAPRAPALPARAAPPALRRLVLSAIDPVPARRPADGGAWLEGLLGIERGAARRREVRSGAAIGAAGALVAAAAVAAATWRSPAPEPEGGPRIPVAVADVQNGTADPDLNGLSGMLVTSLEQSRRLVVLTRSRMVDAIRQLGHEPPEVLDEPLAREVGRSVGVRALLLGTVHRFDDRYAIELRALDPVRNEYLFTLKEEGRGKASVPDLIDRLARGTRERLSDDPGASAGARRPVADLTTGNLAAYEHYFRARQAIDLRQFPKARSELEAALAIDPEFALAHLGVVVLDAWTHALGGSDVDPADRAHLETALRLVDRLPEKERLMLLAWKATVDGRSDESLRLRDEAATRFPQDKEAVFWAGDVRFHLGDMAGAVPYFERALALDPDYRLAFEHVVHALFLLGRHEDALGMARRWAEAARDAESRRAVGRQLLALGREAEADAVFRAANGGGTPAYPEVVSWLAHRGRIREAEARARLAVAAREGSGPPRDQEERKLARSEREALANVLALQGRLAEVRRVREEIGAAGARERAVQRIGLALGTRAPADARAAVDALRAAGMDAEPMVTMQASLALALAGDPAGARELSRPVREGPRWASVPEPMRVILDAVLARQDGRGAEGEAALRALKGKVSSPDVAYQVLFALGEWAVHDGRPAAAIEPLEQAIGFRWMPEGGAWAWLHPRVLYLASLASEGVGDRERARARVDALLALWKGADPDLPLLAEVRALRRRLSGGQVAERPAAAP